MRFFYVLWFARSWGHKYGQFDGVHHSPTGTTTPRFVDETISALSLALRLGLHLMDCVSGTSLVRGLQLRRSCSEDLSASGQLFAPNQETKPVCLSSSLSKCCRRGVT